jgi:hypothetical protein
VAATCDDGYVGGALTIIGSKDRGAFYHQVTMGLRCV